ncbi:MAG: ATP-binding protein, partial [Alphaproteobacteria bacterium]|nr:ATP-binding protein [Alphaproteobacteria bacterium]
MLAAVLRARHAKQAETIAKQGWAAPGGTEYLLDDGELRAFYGEVIGKIAHSHWWSVSELEARLPLKVGAGRSLPGGWAIDPVKIACLLRTADAAHLDARRAPRFMMAITRPRGHSERHWSFQNKLGPPERENDSLVYTSGPSFGLEDAEAWWLCFDTLCGLRKELDEVDILLAETGRPRLQVRQVAGVGSPERLAKYIRTEGWEPADARLTVSDIPAIIEMLGGKKLYGDDPTIALRELIQNACDAIRARRVLEDRPPEWGEVRIRFRETAEGTWLEVADNGIGMGRRILTGPLLNFGQSFWRSSLMTDEFPGLSAGGMRATGQFGIGFFSVFMLGDRVTVTSRRYDAAASDALTLEFGAGVAGRPLVRPADPAERPNDGGSVVRVLLTLPPGQPGGLLWLWPGWQPEALIACLAPAVDATLIFESDVESAICVRAGDWKTISDQSLLSRL